MKHARRWEVLCIPFDEPETFENYFTRVGKILFSEKYIYTGNIRWKMKNPLTL